MLGSSGCALAAAFCEELDADAMDAQLPVQVALSLLEVLQDRDRDS